MIIQKTKGVRMVDATMKTDVAYSRRQLQIVILVMVAVLSACHKDEVSSFPGFRTPSNFPAPVYKLENNPVTEAGFILGRSLFYEPRLSRNNTVACGSCHIQSYAFTHHGHDVSHGIDDLLGTRNSPPVMNLAWSRSFFWDGGVFDLDLQPINPITNPVEMDEKIENVIAKLQQMPKYTDMFKKAFGSEEITNARMMKALSQFMVMCISSDSKYDKVMRKEEGAVFTEEEQNGYTLFQAKCSACHAEPLFTDGSFRNNGLKPGSINDQGRYAVTLDSADMYRFKVPSLRNLSHTGPYMHDGRFLTINAVLTYYTSQVQQSATLDPLLQQNGHIGITLSDEEMTQIKTFLQTLDDETFLTRKDLSEQ